MRFFEVWILCALLGACSRAPKAPVPESDFLAQIAEVKEGLRRESILIKISAAPAAGDGLASVGYGTLSPALEDRARAIEATYARLLAVGGAAQNPARLRALAELAEGFKAMGGSPMLRGRLVDVVEVLRKALEDPDPAVRAAGLTLAGACGGRVSVDAVKHPLSGDVYVVAPILAAPLAKALSDADLQVKAAATLVRGKTIEPNSPADALAAALRGTPEARDIALASIEARREEWPTSEGAMIASALLPLLDTSDDALRTRAAQALVQVEPGSRARAAFAAWTADSDPERRRRTAGLLGKIYAVPELCALLLNDADAGVRGAAADGLKGASAFSYAVNGLMSDEVVAQDMGRRRIEWLAREGAAELVEKSQRGDKEAGKRLMEMAQAEAQQALDALLAAMADEDAGVGGRAVGAIFIMGPGVRPQETFIRGLKALKGRPVSRRLNYVRRLRNAGASHALILALSDADAAVRALAARLLGEMKAGDAIGALREAMEDEDQNVRMEAKAALATLEDPTASSSRPETDYASPRRSSGHKASSRQTR